MSVLQMPPATVRTHWHRARRAASKQKRMYPVPYRQAAVELYCHLHSLRAAAAMLSCSAASIARWSKQLAPKYALPRPPAPRKMIDLYRQVIRRALLDDPCLTCVDLAALLRERNDLQVSRQLISITRRALGFRRVYCRVRGGTPREEQVQQFLAAHAGLGASYVSLDEAGFDPRPRRSRVYALPGVRVVRRVPPGPAPRRLNLILAVEGGSGLKYSQVLQSSVRAADVASFLQAAPFASGSVVVLDNAAIHKTAAVRAAAAQKGYALLFLPPYSPELNPIELAFAQIKNTLYRRRLQDAAPLTPGRIAGLVEAVSASNVRNFFRHVGREADGLRRPPALQKDT